MDDMNQGCNGMAAANELQRRQIAVLTDTIRSLEERISCLVEQLAWFRRQVFGPKSDRVVMSLDSLHPLLEGLEMKDDAPSAPEKVEVAVHERKKRVRKGEGDTFIEYPDNLPVVRKILDIPEEKKTDPGTGEKLVHIRDEVSRKLAMRPPEFYIAEYVRPIYACRSKPEEGVLMAYMPDHPILKSPADISVMTHVLVSKFADHLPLYRIEEQFSRNGVRISRQTLSNWVLGIGGMLTPLYELMLGKVLSGNAIFVDETPVNLIVRGRGRCQQAYMWVYVGGGGKDPPYRVYEFCLNRKYENVEKTLARYRGHLHSDQYGAYAKLSRKDGVLWDPCMAHVRRKFVEAEHGDPEFRIKIIWLIRNLYRFERVAWSRTAAERLRIRNEKEAPIIDRMTAMVRDRMINGPLLPKSNFRKALEYFMTAEPHLRNYLSNPDARLDNNIAERAIKPLVIGRKNWLFVGSKDGGRATATILSLVQTCRALDIDPGKYLNDILGRFMGHPANRIEELLPDKWKAANEKAGNTQN
jgi:transposase